MKLTDYSNKKTTTNIDLAIDILDIDNMLYTKYGLTEEEIAFIESMIRPMDLTQNGGEDE